MIVPEPEEFIKQLICNFLFYILKAVYGVGILQLLCVFIFTGLQSLKKWEQKCFI